MQLADHTVDGSVKLRVVLIGDAAADTAKELHLTRSLIGVVRIDIDGGSGANTYGDLNCRP
jgi:hypothetical protein